MIPSLGTLEYSTRFSKHLNGNIQTIFDKVAITFYGDFELDG